MQSLVWYRNRLRAMSPQEICWRLGSKVRDAVERCQPARGHRPLPLSSIATGNGSAFSECLQGTQVAPVEDVSGGSSNSLDQWRQDLVASADQICANRLSFFDLQDLDLGSEVNWNYEYSAKLVTPLDISSSIDYRDFSVVGDAKVVWEPNRHQHLVVLARAYRLTKESRYAHKIVEQIESWIRQCPVGRGMNWRSPLELGIRVINWVWALGLISSSEALTSEFGSRVLPIVHEHLRDIVRKYSRYSSANNHLVGEAAAVFIASSYFRTLKHSASWGEESREILEREITKQSFPDGGHCELATGYHLFVLEFFLLAGIAARRSGQDFSTSFWQRLEKMFEFVAILQEGGEELPMFGDCDEGYVLNLGGRHDAARSLLAVGAVLFHRSDFKSLAREFSEPAYWLSGGEGFGEFESIAVPDQSRAVSSKALCETGYYLLQSGRRDSSDQDSRISMTFDCGELGFGPLAAHGHADALSITLRVCGQDVLVDPGTYDYFEHPEWRDYFRSTRAHNTIVIDDRDQSEMLGPFLWGRRARARRVEWLPSSDGGRVSGEHDGYKFLKDPVQHRRTVTLDGQRSAVTVEDELTGKAEHEAALYFHFAEQCRVEQLEENRFEVLFGAVRIVLDMEPCLAVSVHRGDDETKLGWVSRGYHQKRAGTTLVGRIRWTGRRSLNTRLQICDLGM